VALLSDSAHVVKLQLLGTVIINRAKYVAMPGERMLWVGPHR